jgi:hypothetical protein
MRLRGSKAAPVIKLVAINIRSSNLRALASSIRRHWLPHVAEVQPRPSPRLKLRTIEPRPSATTLEMEAAIRIVLLMLSGAVASCATAPSPPTLDVRAICQELTQASASSPELISKDYFAQCLIAHGASAQTGQPKGP